MDAVIDLVVATEEVEQHPGDQGARVSWQKAQDRVEDAYRGVIGKDHG